MDSNYVTGDDQVASDNYDFLQGFFKLMPSLKGRPFYLTGMCGTTPPIASLTLWYLTLTHTSHVSGESYAG